MENDYRNITNEEIKEFIPFLRGHIAKKYPGDPEKEELFCAGLEGIAEGIRRFDPEKKVPRSYWVQRYAAHYVMNESKRRRAETAEKYRQAENAPELAVRETSDPAIDIENEEILRLAFNALTEEEQNLINALYREGLSLRAVARRDGVTVDAVFRLHHRALRKMKEAAGCDE